MLPFERTPVDPITERRVTSLEVQAVQVGEVAISVPPGSVVCLSATSISLEVIVVIFGGKLCAIGKKNEKIRCFKIR